VENFHLRTIFIMWSICSTYHA